MTTIGRVLVSVTLALAIAAGPLPAIAASGSGTGVTITGVTGGYEFGGGGNYRLDDPSGLRPGGIWVPVHVTLANSGDTAAVRLVISDNGPQNNTGPAPSNGPSYRTDYTTDVTLGSGARKAVTLYIRAADISSSLTVDAQSNGHTIATQPVSLNPQTGGTLSVGVLSDDTATRSILRSLKFGDTALSVAQFSDAAPLDTQPQALGNFDLIVLSNYASDTLTAAQADALRAWVQQGGTLLVAGGADAQKTMGHLAPALQAATLRSTTTASSLPELAQVAGDRVPTSGPLELSVADPVSGAVVLLRHGGVPLAVDRPLGRGHLVYSALEPASPPLSTWPAGAQSDYWRHLLASALQGPLDALISEQAQSGPAVWLQNGQNANLISDLGVSYSGHLPALQVYIVLIILYVLILGPGNYIVLRRLRRLEWSWGTVPALAVVFGIGTFGLAYARNGGDVITNIDTVVYLDPGGSSRLADSYMGILAPFQGDYTLSTQNAALVWGLGGDNAVSGIGGAGGPPLGMTVNETPPTTVQLTGMQMWGQRNIAIRQQLAIPGDLTAHLTIRGNTVSGEITNGTRLTLRDCVIAGAMATSAPIGQIAPGQTVRVPPFQLDNGSSNGTSNNGPLNNLYSAVVGALGGVQAAAAASPSGRYNAILSTIFPTGSAATPNAPLTVIAWSNAPLPQFTINGSMPHRNDLDLIVAPLQATLAPGRLTLTPGDFQVGVLDTTVTPNTIAGSNGLTLNAGDRVDVQLALPAGTHRIRAGTITLAINANNGSSSLSPNSAALWNWVTQRWDTVDASTGSATIARAGKYVSSDGRIILRVQASQNGDLTFNDIDQNIQIGVTGTVQP